MSETPVSAPVFPVAPDHVLGGPQAWFRDLVAAEWIKFRSVRSTYWVLLLAAVPSVLVGVLICQSIASDWTRLRTRDFDFDNLLISFRGFQFGQLVFGALGVLVISSEYSTGLIRTTFAAVPQRRAVLAAKSTVLGTAALVFGELLAFTAFFGSQAFLHGIGRGQSIGSPGALRAVLCAGFAMAAIALIGTAFGALLRSPAGALSAMFGLVFILPGAVSGFPSPWNDRIGKFLPDAAIAQLLRQNADPSMLSRPWSFAVLVAYPVVFLGLAAYVLKRRDA
ncbi:MAG TPA: ABC transporter permease subunit [Actinocrinis sp.]|nr:ABC transporter permease subunit [Actinocrinis sp.]